ncbi:molybdenum cofactor biosynthesis protein MoaE [Allobranchiibius huperziae]|uniref:Molybdopterin synthase catalytic subunit n=1 Tax=Allobranchiibius huperziae TaxID=1874116 RepID=A0A853D9E6_9MICO|nr:molybdopterin synthase catalytic subunit [Allobranchiibius huperziae]
MDHDARVRLAHLRDAPLSVDEVLRAVQDPEAGGVGLFVGQVRAHDHAQPVVRLDYTAHPTAEQTLHDVVRSVLTDEITAAAAVHRTGELVVGDLAVVVAVSAAHRQAALRVCAELIDVLKTTVPIWKHQVFADGTDEWVGL